MQKSTFNDEGDILHNIINPPYERDKWLFQSQISRTIRPHPEMENDHVLYHNGHPKEHVI